MGGGRRRRLLVRTLPASPPARSEEAPDCGAGPRYWWKRGVAGEAGPPAAPGLSVRSGALSSRSQFRNSTVKAAARSRSRERSAAGCG